MLFAIVGGTVFGVIVFLTSTMVVGHTPPFPIGTITGTAAVTAVLLSWITKLQ